MAKGFTIKKHTDSHVHCFHAYRGALLMVIPDGQAVEKCCKCEATRLTHIDHLHEKHRGKPTWSGSSRTILRG